MMPFLREFCRKCVEHSRGGTASTCGGGRFARAAGRPCSGVKAHEIIFTSGGTEACNLAVLGLARAHAPRGRHIITTAVEHHAVLHACESLKHHEGFDLTILPVDGAGRVDPEDLESALRPDTVLVSVMHANNETGTIQPIEELAAICRERRVCFHTDAIQSFGKLPVRPDDLGVSAVSLAAHKFYGPPGAGALYLRSGIAISRIAHGGSHENTRRPGTENVAAIVGMAAAAELAESKRSADQPRLRASARSALAGNHEQISERRAQRPSGADLGEYPERQLSRS